MERTQYQPGIDVHSEHLNFTELSKIAAIKKVVTKFGTTGPVQGLVVSPDLIDPTKVAVSAGYGFAYGGDFVELLTDETSITINNNIGELSYVALKIVETEAYNLPNRITGAIESTRVTNSFEVEVLSAAAWLALADKSLYTLLAIVTGSGGSVNADHIRRSVILPHPIMSVVTQPVGLSGVSVRTISSNTSAGAGLLKYIASAKTISWRPYGDATDGPACEIGIDGTYTLYNSLAVSYIVIDVIDGSLPLSNTTEYITVVNILSQYELAIGTANDNLHRALMGSGMPSVRNPHGQSLDDFDPGTFQSAQDHQLNLHSPGILSATPGTTSCRVTKSGSSTISISPVLPGDSVSTNGKRITQFSNYSLDFTGSPADTYFVYVEGNGRVVKSTTQPSSDEVILASVIWDGVLLTDSNITDTRVWGAISPFNKITADDDTVELNVTSHSKSLRDNLAKIRYMIRMITGEALWTDIPTVALGDYAEHVLQLYTDPDTIHGVSKGHGGGLDADKLDGKHYTEIIDAVNLDHGNKSLAVDGVVVHGVSKGHGGGLDADKLDGYESSEIPAAEVIPRTGIGRNLNAWITGIKVEGEIPNGSFEDITDENLPVDWTGMVLGRSVSTDSIKGSRCFAVELDEEDVETISSSLFDISLLSLQNIAFACKVSNTNLIVEAYLLFYDRNRDLITTDFWIAFEIFNSDDHAFTDTKWQQIFATDIPVKQDAVFCSLVFKMTAPVGESGTVYIDDVRFVSGDIRNTKVKVPEEISLSLQQTNSESYVNCGDFTITIPENTSKLHVSAKIATASGTEHAFARCVIVENSLTSSEVSTQSLSLVRKIMVINNVIVGEKTLRFQQRTSHSSVAASLLVDNAYDTAYGTAKLITHDCIAGDLGYTES